MADERQVNELLNEVKQFYEEVYNELVMFNLLHNPYNNFVRGTDEVENETPSLMEQEDTRRRLIQQDLEFILSYLDGAFLFPQPHMEAIMYDDSDDVSESEPGLDVQNPLQIIQEENEVDNIVDNPLGEPEAQTDSDSD